MTEDLVPKYVDAIPAAEVLLYIAYPTLVPIKGYCGDVTYGNHGLRLALELIQKFVDDLGWCVSVDETTFIYTGGTEPGIIVRAIQYARPGMSNDENYDRMRNLADILAVELNQDSYTIIHNGKSMYFAIDNKK